MDDKPLTVVFSGTVSRADKARSDYLLLPFDVPPGIHRLHVRYNYTDPMHSSQQDEHGNVVDIGIFDPRGSAFPRGSGFRGWSGSARREFTIEGREATPGYLSGPIQPGRWEVILGLYRIAAQGCRYEVAITMQGDAEEPSEGDAPPPNVSHPKEARWYRGDLHSHTHHSEAQGSLADLAAAARRRGLDFLAVTEHNTISHFAHLAAHETPDLLLIPGEEVTTYYGHANVWGATRWCDFRCRGKAQMAEVIRAAHEAGGLFSINHPKRGGPPWEYDLFEVADCLEVWQGPWFWGNHESLALWENLLRQGLRLVAVGGSDRHQPPLAEDKGNGPLGQPTTWVYAQELSSSAVLAGIKAGHVMLSADVNGPMLYLEADGDGDGRYEAMCGDGLVLSPGQLVRWRCRVIGGQGQLLRISSTGRDWMLPVESSTFLYTWETLASRDEWYRAELIVPDELEKDPMILMRSALTNPIYLSVTTGHG